MRLRSGYALLAALVLLASSGCSSNPEKPPQTPAINIPQNDTPAHAVQRFMLTYEGKQEAAYANMFTKDFVFDFSSAVDPNLAFLYADGWVKSDEIESSKHLFSGYTPPGGSQVLAAKSISLTFAVMTPQDDESNPDPATHKVLFTRVDGWFVVPQTGSDDLNYVISNNWNAFYFVRGDAATDLDSGQPADTSHWYIYRWEDLTGSNPARKPASQTITWARVRALYRSDTNPSLAANETPQGAIARLIGSYEGKFPNAYAGMFTGDFTYEFSNSTDPVLVQQYATGWFKNDETLSSSHLFSGYTPPEGTTLPAASSIDIQLAVESPTDDNGPGVDPVTHKLLATRVDGTVVVPQETGPITFTIQINFNVFYLVRGDAAVNLDASQPADAYHWYVYRWVDITGYASQRLDRLATVPATWGKLKGLYH
jgi:hypothetical protein